MGGLRVNRDEQFPMYLTVIWVLYWNTTYVFPDRTTPDDTVHRLDSAQAFRNSAAQNTAC